MTEHSRIEQTTARSRRTRRQLLTGGAVAAGFVAAEVLARGTAAQAANGNPILMGGFNAATSDTSIDDSGGDTTFDAMAEGSGMALVGNAVDGIGVYGTTDSTAANASAVLGEVTSVSPGAYSAAVRGMNDGTGGSGIGVYGSQAGSGWGVYGFTASGTGVFGQSSPGLGVRGDGTTGVAGTGTATGVSGISESPHGTGVLAENLAGGKALQVNGVAAFSRSGVAAVPAGRSQVSQRLPLTSGSFVLATIQGNLKGLYVQGVTIAAGAHGSFTIHLSQAVKSKTKVAWLVVN